MGFWLELILLHFASGPVFQACISDGDVIRSRACLLDSHAWVNFHGNTHVCLCNVLWVGNCQGLPYMDLVLDIMQLRLFATTGMYDYVLFNLTGAELAR